MQKRICFACFWIASNVNCQLCWKNILLHMTLWGKGLADVKESQSLKFIEVLLCSVGSSHKSAFFLGLWACLCFDGFENNGHRQLQYWHTGRTMLYEKVQFSACRFVYVYNVSENLVHQHEFFDIVKLVTISSSMHSPTLACPSLSSCLLFKHCYLCFL